MRDVRRFGPDITHTRVDGPFQTPFASSILSSFSRVYCGTSLRRLHNTQVNNNETHDHTEQDSCVERRYPPTRFHTKKYDVISLSLMMDEL